MHHLQSICLLLLLCAANSLAYYRVALLVIDIQNCFMEGGNQAVQDGDDVIPIINNIRNEHGDKFHLIVLSQDWHCPNHVSFASQHRGCNPYDKVQLLYNEKGDLCQTRRMSLDYSRRCLPTERKQPFEQTLWPDHCVMDTPDADIHSQLKTKESDVVIKKGMTCHLDSYSAFYDSGKYSKTELHNELIRNKIDVVIIVGLATDLCVHWTAKDALSLGYQTYVIKDATRGMDAANTVKAIEDMQSRGITIAQTDELGPILEALSGAGYIKSPPMTVLTFTSLIVALVRCLY